MNKKNTIKTVKIVLAIITFPLHIVVTGSLIWANNFKKILEDKL